MDAVSPHQTRFLAPVKQQVVALKKRIFHTARNRGSCPGRELANRGRSTATPGPGGTGGRGAQSHLWLKLQWSPTGRGQWPFLAWSQQSQELHGHQ